MTQTRRDLLQGAGAMAAASLASPAASAPQTERVDDEAYWREVAAAYDVKKDIINLENGNWGVMARPVAERYFKHLQRVNHDNSYYARRLYDDDYRAGLALLTDFLGAAESEIALTRGATEALKGLITGYNRLKPGEAVMYADLDYYSMQAMMDWRAAKSGCSVVRLAVPEPATHDGLVAFYKQALTDNPAVRLLLLTHVSHRTGLVMPVREIIAAARERDVDCIVDAAHSWGQIDFRVDDLGADFVGFNLHKWIGAPIGVGLIYIREGRLAAIDPDPGASGGERDRVAGRVHAGTSDYAAALTVPDALKFHLDIGPARKAARLAFLRTLWVEAARGLAGLQILTPDDPRLHAGITSFRLAGRTSTDENIALADHLLTAFNIFTVYRNGVAAGACVRATPSVYNSPDDAMALAAALRAISGS